MDGPGGDPLIRPSDPERDIVLRSLPDAYAVGRLTEAEFSRRLEAALSARTRAQLARLLADLPRAAVLSAAQVARLPRASRFAVAIGSIVRRSGRWRVPRRFTAIAYKGVGVLELRAADFSSGIVTITALAYKARIRILVPVGARVVARGLGVTTGGAPGAAMLPLPPDALVIKVRGYPVLGAVEAICA